MIKYWIGITIIVLNVACQPSTPEWTFEQVIDLDTLAPLGIAYDGTALWISDSDHNTVAKIDKTGKRLSTYNQFERPMHIAYAQNTLYIPEYTTDTIRTLLEDKVGFVNLTAQLDAPAGIDVQNDKIAIADFYNHQIVLMNKDSSIIIGTKGHEKGEFHYPTDVQFSNSKIYVADAYNHRIQVFTENGMLLQVIGEAEEMNATTGIYVTDKHIFATDFENDRVLIYDLKGKIVQILSEKFSKPTDVLIIDNQLFITNYKGKSLTIFTLK